MAQQTQQSGFSIVELLVVIVAIMLLSSLSFIAVINTQRSARDAERAEDVNALARHFEAFYDDTTFFGQTLASYPGQISVECGDPPVYENANMGIFRSPSEQFIDNSYCVNPENPTPPSISVQGAQNTNESPGSVLPQPGPDNDIYVYQAFHRDNQTCPFTGGEPDTACVRFNLYYYSEEDGEVKKVSSRRQ